MSSTWFEVLVIILSVFLAVFLLLISILVYKFIQISKAIKNVVNHAEKVAAKAENISNFFEKTAVPAALVNLVSNLTTNFSKKRSKK